MEAEVTLCLRDVLDQVKVGGRLWQAGSVVSQECWELHNLSLDRQAEQAGSLEQNEALGKSFLPCTLPASLIILALGLGALNDKMIDLKFTLPLPKKIVRLPGCFRIFEALVWNKWLSKSLPRQPSRPERMTTCILGGPRP